MKCCAAYHAGGQRARSFACRDRPRRYARRRLRCIESPRLGDQTTGVYIDGELVGYRECRWALAEEYEKRENIAGMRGMRSAWCFSASTVPTSDGVAPHERHRGARVQVTGCRARRLRARHACAKVRQGAQGGRYPAAALGGAERVAIRRAMAMDPSDALRRGGGPPVLDNGAGGRGCSHVMRQVPSRHDDGGWSRTDGVATRGRRPA